MILLITFIIVNYLSFSQVFKTEYIKSFNKIENSQEISFRKIVNSQGKLMTSQEALDYVYKGDTSRLYCIHKIFNMETEKVSGISKELTLPKKYFLIEFNNYYLIANSSFLCQDVNKLSQVSLILHVINKNYESTDSLEVYKGNEYDDELLGMINPVNGKVFITGFEKEIGRYAKLLEINQESLKFEEIKEKNNAGISFENLKKELEKLGWYEEFLSQ